MKTNDVFGVSPQIRKDSYVDRGNLDQALTRALGRNQHVAIRGPSKSGKSWLRQAVLKDAITVQCRMNHPSTDIYVDALSQLGVRLVVSESKQGTFSGRVSGTIEAGVKLLAKVGLASSVESASSATQNSAPVGRDINDLRHVAEILRESGRRVVVEDFHYMSTEGRTSFAFDLKALWDYGVYVVVVGVWCESNLLLHLNPDLTGRVWEQVIDWNRAELREVLNKGARQLNISFEPSVETALVGMAYANVGILQQLALMTLDEADIHERPKQQLTIRNEQLAIDAGMAYADQLNAVYQQFAKSVSAGIRNRKNATGIYAHAMAVILAASDEELVQGLALKLIFERAVARQPRIQLGNLKSVLGKVQDLQVDQGGRGLVLAYSQETEEVTVVDRQLLLYRKFSTVKWPWDDLIASVDSTPVTPLLGDPDSGATDPYAGDD